MDSYSYIERLGRKYYCTVYAMAKKNKTLRVGNLLSGFGFVFSVMFLFNRTLSSCGVECSFRWLLTSNI